MGADLRRAGRDALVLEHLAIAKTVALRIYETLPTMLVDFDDMVHAGIMGLVDAAEKFDVNRQVKFASYAKYRIRGAIIDHLRQIDPVSRDCRKTLKQIDAGKSALASRGESIEDNALAGEIGMDVASLRKFRAEAYVGNVRMPMIQAKDGVREVPIPDKRRPDPEKMALIESHKRDLAAAIATLPPRYQQALQLYFFEDLTMKEVAKVMGINESRVSQIVKQSLRRCREQMPGRSMRDFSEIAA